MLLYVVVSVFRTLSPLHIKRKAQNIRLISIPTSLSTPMLEYQQTEIYNLYKNAESRNEYQLLNVVLHHT